MDPAPMPGKKKTSPLVWVLGGIGVFVLLIVMVLVGGGLFVASKIKDAGFDSDLAKRNPTLAAAKLAVSLNPDIEVVNVDEDKGLLTIKDKKTGKSITLNAEDVKNGKFSISDDSSGEKVTFGGEAKLPSWVPLYPGAKAEGAIAASGGENEGAMAHFKTSDSTSKVASFYQDALKKGGFEITSDGASAESGGIIVAEDAARNRTVSVTISSGDEGTSVMLTYGAKN